MKWIDIHKILLGPIPQRGHQALIPNDEVQISKESRIILAVMSEADTVVRVFLCVIAAIPQGKKSLLIKLQPSVEQHETFTDFLLTNRDNKQPDRL